VIILCYSCKSNNDKSVTSALVKITPAITYDFLNSYPHDTTSFTEGLLIHQGKIYESTGASQELPQTRSLFGVLDTVNGKIEKKVELDKEKYFGEGITFLNGKVYQLTYKNQIGFIYDAHTFKKLGDFPIPSKEGWGLTTDGVNLIMSDGTHTLTYLDPNTLKVVKMLAVTENGFAKEALNELEFIKGYIYANVWTTNTIAKIDTTNGKVVGILDLSPLASESANLYKESLEMNGIAYDSARQSVFVTGKMWPKLFEIKIKE
jgi:glutamine cyclotransferase